MPQPVYRTSQGLYNQFNNVNVPQGALLEADNVVISREGVISKRRGLQRYSDSAFTDPIDQIMQFSDRLIVHSNDTLYKDDGSGSFSAFSGTFSQITGHKIRSIEDRLSLYFTSNTGLYKLDDLTNDPTLAGLPQCPDTELATTGTGGFFLEDNQTAYRVCFTRTDSNGKLVRSAPSPRETLVNPSGSGVDYNVNITFTLPDGIIAGDVYEIYRTTLSGAGTVDPGDDHARVATITITSSDITAGTITHLDTIDDFQRGINLYTNATQETILQENGQPLLGKDLALWKGHVWVANTQDKHQLEIQMVDVSGITTGTDQITINGVTYIAEAAEDIANREFEVDTASATISQRIENTAKSLIRVINRHSGNTEVYATYNSGVDEVPGKILIKARTFAVTQFSVTASSTGYGNKFSPQIPTSGTAVSSDNFAEQHRLTYSKFEQGEHFPATNFFRIGSEQSPIQRIIALKDSLFVLKEEGIFRISGETVTSFLIKPADPNTRILAVESAVALNNKVIFYSTQGIVQVDEGGTVIISRPIEVLLDPIEQFANFEDIAYGIAYETDREYIILLPSTNSDTSPQQGYAYNYLTKTWTRKYADKDLSVGVVLDDTNRLFFAHNTDKFLLQERRAFNNTDWSDEAIPASITAISGRNLTLSYSYSAAPLAIGQGIVQGSFFAKIVGVDGSVVTIDRDPTGVTVAACTVELRIPTRIRWAPETLGNPGVWKQFSTVQWLFERDTALTHKISFASNLNGAEETLPDYVISGGSGWGDFPWGDSWDAGAASKASTPIRVFVPRDKQRCRALSIIHRQEVAREGFDMNSMAIWVRPYSERAIRS